SKPNLNLEELVNMFKKLSLRSKDNKHRKKHHGVFDNISPTPLPPRKVHASKNSGATKNKKYPKVNLGDGCGNLSIKMHLNNIWKSVHFIENDIEYGIFEKLHIIEYKLSYLNKAKLLWIKSDTETKSSSSDLDWYLNPIKLRKNYIYIKKKKVDSSTQKHCKNKHTNYDRMSCEILKE
ncbi:44968_t:CDS:1, partial [Gigaspora margarita]